MRNKNRCSINNSVQSDGDLLRSPAYVGKKHRICGRKTWTFF